MSKITILIISSLLLVSSVGCENPARNSAEAPSTVKESPQTPDVKSVEDSKKDAQSELRRKQLNADIKAREQRSNVTGGDTDRATGDLKSEVRSKLEANIPGSQLTINADKQGAVVISGTVSNAADKTKIDGLAKQIKGVKTVTSDQVVVTPATKN
ncbi:MAG TPA: BON domain-containing protein [Oculatellaceae cyanobacterium]|jgi:flagellar motor protein MotB